MDNFKINKVSVVAIFFIFLGLLLILFLVKQTTSLKSRASQSLNNSFKVTQVSGDGSKNEVDCSKIDGGQDCDIQSLDLEIDLSSTN